jgi:hypothetical protein
MRACKDACASAWQIRGQSCGEWGHARTPAAMAELQAGWEMFLQFAVEAGAL